MKSHNQVSCKSADLIARKINRSGIDHLLAEEKGFVKTNLISVAGRCTLERAAEVFAFFGKTLPEGFVCVPVSGEKDALIERLKRETDKRK